MLVGEKVPVAPVGRPETVRATAELKVAFPAVVKLRLPDPPGPMVSAVAEPFRVKAGASTVRVTLAV
jgi:hypothetical protein